MEQTGQESAREAGLHYATDREKGYTRTGTAPRFGYADANGKRVRDRATLKRIRGLVLPPAWTSVWIAADPLAHLQATGRDARGRKQYRYHHKFRQVREATKFDRLPEFAAALPAIRRSVKRDMHAPSLSRERVLATVVQLLERTLIRVGNDEYARANKSYGLTTLRNRHVDVRGARVVFTFRAKSGVQQRIELDDPLLARSVRRCQDLPGQMLFQYRDDNGEVKTVDSSDVNEYLHRHFTAKDFRTWAGTVFAARALADLAPAPSPTATKREMVKAIDQVAKRLGNTRAVCRACYIHPAVLDAYASGVTLKTMTAPRKRIAGLSADESAVLALLASARRSKIAKAA